MKAQASLLAVSLYIPRIHLCGISYIDLCVQAQAAALTVYWKDIPSGREVNCVYRAPHQQLNLRNQLSLRVGRSA
jgi:hypothetical protein